MHDKDAKTILSAKNGMNLYRGCTHGCIYCDSRSTCYQMDHDFEDVEVKQNAPALLDAALRAKRTPCMIGTGSMSDPYLPLERELRLTRTCLELVERYGFGVTLITKSNLVLRDLDLLKRINEKTKCVVQITLTTYDETLCRIIEPNVCTTKERFETLKVLRDHNIPTVVWLCPILPFINDTEENLRGILGYCQDAGVFGILCFGFGLTLRDGNRAYFYNKLDRYFPGLKQKYSKMYGNSYSLESPNSPALWRIFQEECTKNGILHDNHALFSYLNEFPERFTQLRFF